MTLPWRTQSEVAPAADAEVLLLARRIDHHPIAIHQRLSVHHARLWAAERPIIPDHLFCAHEHQLVAIDLGQRGSLLQNWIEDSLRHLSFHEWSFSCC